MRRKVLIVDVAPLLYQIHNTAVGKFSIQAGPRKGELTGIRYGLLRNIAAYKRELEAHKVVLAWDCVGTPLKAEVLGPKVMSTYKAGRPAAPKGMYGQVPAAKELIGLTSWTQVEADGYEADDICGTVARKLEGDGHEVYVVSTDNDFCQCVSENVKIYVPGTKGRGRGIKSQIEAMETNDHIKDIGWVKNNFGVHPKALLAYRAFAGDVSDNIAGVIDTKAQPGLAAMLNTIFTINKNLDNPADVCTELRKHGWTTITPENAAMFALNWHLMALAAPPKLTIKKGTADAQALNEQLKALEFKSLQKILLELVA